jgi:flagellar motility protein MotE (MotC chaperone)
MSNDIAHSSNVLLTLGVLFTLGGATRFLPSPEAVAEAAPPVAASKPAQDSADAAANKPAATPVKAAPASQDTQSVCFTGTMAADLKEDRWLFETEQAALDQEKISVKALQAELDARATELASLQATLDERWKKMQDEAGGDIDHLARMYGVMKPDQAAAIFNQMDPAFAAGFLRRLSSDQAGLILAGMEADKAYIVSVNLASMNDDLRNDAPRR